MLCNFWTAASISCFYLRCVCVASITISSSVDNIIATSSKLLCRLEFLLISKLSLLCFSCLRILCEIWKNVSIFSESISITLRYLHLSWNIVGVFKSLTTCLMYMLILSLMGLWLEMKNLYCIGKHVISLLQKWSFKILIFSLLLMIRWSYVWMFVVRFTSVFLRVFWFHPPIKLDSTI